MGEVAAFAQVLTHEGILKTIQEQVRFARVRFGRYDLIDFVAVLIGYGVSSEPILLAFYVRLLPFAEPFIALFGRNQLPYRSTLSRFLAALDQPTVEALRTCFQKDLLARKSFPSSGGLCGPPQWARPSFTHGFPGSAFNPQPDGSLRCPANHPLYPQERRPERDGSLRVLYAARIGYCRSCQMPCTVSREQHHAQTSTGECSVMAT